MQGKGDKVKQTVFLIVNSQTGECRLRKTPSAGPIAYVFQVNLESPGVSVPLSSEAWGEDG